MRVEMACFWNAFTVDALTHNCMAGSSNWNQHANYREGLEGFRVDDLKKFARVLNARYMKACIANYSVGFLPNRARCFPLLLWRYTDPLLRTHSE